MTGYGGGEEDSGWRGEREGTGGRLESWMREAYEGEEGGEVAG